MKYFTLLFFMLIAPFFAKSDTIKVRVVPFNSQTKARTYSQARTVTANRTLVYSKYQNSNSDDGITATLRFGGLDQGDVSYYYYMEVYYGGPRSSSGQNIFLGSSLNAATGQVIKDNWKVTGYDYTYSPENVTLSHTSGIAIIFVWQVAIPADTSPIDAPPNSGSNGEYGTVIIPDPTIQNPNPLPELTDPPIGSDPPDPENPDPENPDPENPDPENPDPENPDPENPDPENPDPENPEPENPNPDNPNPENPDDPNKVYNVKVTNPVLKVDVTNDTQNVTVTNKVRINDEIPLKVQVTNTPLDVYVKNSDLIDYKKMPGATSENPTHVKPWIELPEVTHDDVEPEITNPLENTFKKLKPEIKLPEPADFVFPSFNIPIIGSRNVIIRLDSGLYAYSEVREAYNFIKSLVRSIATLLVTLLTFKYVLKLFRKNS